VSVIFLNSRIVFGIRLEFLLFWDILCVGALKATSNRGLQPAMDHLVENEGKAVPDLSTVSSSTQSAGGGDPMDEDEDLEALRAVYGAGAKSGDGEMEAKVRSDLALPAWFRIEFPLHWAFSEHQVQPMWEGIQEHRARELPRGEERS